MPVCARIATLLLLAVHLAGASAPCPSQKLPDREPAHPCPAHAAQSSAPSSWFDALCPCGCEHGAPPGIDGSRIPPALMLARLTALAAPPHSRAVSAPRHWIALAPAPPDHVPLALA